MRWIKASEREPKEHHNVIFQWDDTKVTWRTNIHSLRDTNGNVGGLSRLSWLDESSEQPSPPTRQDDEIKLPYEFGENMTSHQKGRVVGYKEGYKAAQASQPPTRLIGVIEEMEEKRLSLIERLKGGESQNIKRYLQGEYDAISRYLPKLKSLTDEPPESIVKNELDFIVGKKYSWAGHFHCVINTGLIPKLGKGYSFTDCGKINTFFINKDRELLERLFYTVDETMICPMTKKHCDDECCPVGSECNLKPAKGISPTPTDEPEYQILDNENKWVTIDKDWYDRAKETHRRIIPSHPTDEPDAGYSEGVTRLERVIDYIKRNLVKINNVTWRVYQEQALAHIEDAEYYLLQLKQTPATDEVEKQFKEKGNKLSEIIGAIPDLPFESLPAQDDLLPNLKKSTENLSKIKDKDEWLNEVRGDDKQDDWELFLDESYYHLWAVRKKTDRDFNSQMLFHVQSKQEAEALCIVLSKK